jgi:hypothetical protein
MIDGTKAVNITGTLPDRHKRHLKAGAQPSSGTVP